MSTFQASTARARGALIALIAAELALACLLASPCAAWANSGTLEWGDGQSQTFDNVSDLMSKASSVGGDVTISLSDDWFIKDARLEIPEGRSYTFYLNGHMINREKAGSFGDDDFWRGEGKCQAIYVRKNASLTIYGGDATTQHRGSFSDAYADGQGGTDYYFWKYDGTGSDILTGGLITGGACDDSDGAGGIALAGEGASCTLVDVTVAGNLSDEYSFITDYYGYGGGVGLFAKNCKLTMRNCKVMYNHAEDSGGGIYVSGKDCSIEIEGCEISHNLGCEDVGGIRVHGTATNYTVYLKNTKVKNNRGLGLYGGGIFAQADGGELSLRNCEVCGNVTSSQGGGILVRGLGETPGSSLILYDTEVSNNVAGSFGGGIAFVSSGDLKITGSKFCNNTAAPKGGRLVLDTAPGASTKLVNTIIEGNTAGTMGGGVYAEESTTKEQVPNLTLSDGTVIRKNAAGTLGGGIYLEDTSTSSYVVLSSPDGTARIEGNTASQGGGIYANSYKGSITGVTISGNHASDNGGGIYQYIVAEGNAVTLADLTVQNNTAVNAGGGVYVAAGKNDYLAIGSASTIVDNKSGVSVTSTGDIVGGTADNLSLPIESNGDRAVLLRSADTAAAEGKIGVTVRDFGAQSSDRTLTDGDVSNWAQGSSYLLRSDNIAYRVANASEDSCGPLYLTASPAEHHVYLYGADSETPALDETHNNAETVTIATTGYDKDGQEAVAFEVEGLDGVTELVPKDGQVSFTMPADNDVTLRARYRPEVTKVNLKLTDSSTWWQLGTDASLLTLTSLSVTDSEGNVHEVDAGAADVQIKELRDENDIKDLTYTVSFTASTLIEAGVWLGEADPDVDGTVTTCKGETRCAAFADRDKNGLTVRVMATFNRKDWLGEWEWREVDGGVEITHYSGLLSEVEVPQTLDGNWVVSIGDEAFAGKIWLDEVTLHDNVTSIGAGAFKGCSRLAKVRIEDTVASIGEGAFEGCSEGLTMYGPRACPAQAWAAENGVRYVPDTVLATIDVANGTRAAQQELKYGELVQRPADPQREGHTFLGWYVLGTDRAFDFDAAPTADVHIIAKWEGLPCTVEFDAAGGSPEPGAQALAWACSAARPEDPEREGYAFLGWYAQGEDEEYDFARAVTSDLKLTAKWEPLAYLVEFDAAGGSPAPKAQAVVWGKQVTRPEDPTREGYAFLGWYAEGSEKAYDFDTAVKADLKLTARWDQLTYQVSFDTAGGSAAPSPQTVAWGGKATKPADPARAGYSFLGWYAQGSEGAYDFGSAVRGDLALTARWRSLAPTSFIDVPEGAWYYPWVTKAAQQGLMTGYTDASGAYTGYFGPEDPLTRAQVATVLWRMAGSPRAADGGRFPDVAAGRYYSQAVSWCAEKGIVTGYTGGQYEGLFRPDADVTREELATMVARYARWAGVDTSDAPTAAFERCLDTASVSGWSRDSMVWCAARGVVTGKETAGGLYLAPQEGATRAQAAKVFVQALAVTDGAQALAEDGGGEGAAAQAAEEAQAQAEEYAPVGAQAEEATFDEVAPQAADANAGGADGTAGDGQDAGGAPDGTASDEGTGGGEPADDAGQEAGDGTAGDGQAEGAPSDAAPDPDATFDEVSPAGAE